MPFVQLSCGGRRIWRLELAELCDNSCIILALLESQVLKDFMLNLQLAAATRVSRCTPLLPTFVLFRASLARGVWCGALLDGSDRPRYLLLLLVEGYL